jgi:NADPH-dependent F420 reductase
MTNRLILTVAILGGTGKLGPGLAMRWTSAGYQVIVGSRKESKAKGVAEDLNQRLGVESIQGMLNAEAAHNANICVLTVNADAHQPALESLQGAIGGKILVDTTSRVDFKDPKPPEPPAAARLAQDILGGGARVVAAFQTVPAHTLKERLGKTLAMDTLICADDLEAAEEVIKLAHGAGIGAYYAGGLDDALVVEGMTALLIKMNRHYQSKEGTLRVLGFSEG